MAKAAFTSGPKDRIKVSAHTYVNKTSSKACFNLKFGNRQKKPHVIGVEDLLDLVNDVLENQDMYAALAQIAEEAASKNIKLSDGEVEGAATEEPAPEPVEEAPKQRVVSFGRPAAKAAKPKAPAKPARKPLPPKPAAKAVPQSNLDRMAEIKAKLGMTS